MHYLEHYSVLPCFAGCFQHGFNTEGVVGRTKRSANLDSPTKRKSLEPGAYHQEPMPSGGYLRYRCPALGKSGAWYAQDLDPATGKKPQERIAEADDLHHANGRDVLDYAQALAEASAWVKTRAKERQRIAQGETAPTKIRTVRDAVTYYLTVTKADRKSARSAETSRLCAEASILPELGDLLISELTAQRINKWREDLAARGRRKTGFKRQEGQEVEYLPLVSVKKAKTMTPAQLQEANEVAVRRRKSTANWALALLKSALNAVLAEGLIPADHTPWMPVKQFKGVKGRRVRFLSVEDSQRLVNACADPEFRRVVQGGLFTGCRYAELASAKVMDFDAANGSLRVDGKGRDSAVRNIFLTPEGETFFSGLVAGRAGSELLFTRTGVERTTRKDDKQAGGWLKGDSQTPMRLACKAAGIEPLTFHELRHTYASELVRRGVPLMMVAQQLGHKDTRMVEAHYGHLAPSAVKNTIRALVPSLGITEPTKVKALAIRQG